MQRLSSPLSEHSYAEVVTGPKSQTTQPPPTVQGSVHEPPMDQTNARRVADGPKGIEVDNTLGRASNDVNALLGNKNTFGEWQMVTPKKNRKKAKRATKRAQESNKCPHSDSPLKERMPKRQATDAGNSDSEGEKEPRGSPSPSQALSLSKLDLMDVDIPPMGMGERKSTTPKARRATKVNAETKKAKPPVRNTPPHPRRYHSQPQ